MKNIKFLKRCVSIFHTVLLSSWDFAICLFHACCAYHHFGTVGENLLLYILHCHNVQKKLIFFWPNKKNRAQKNLCRGAFRLPNYYLPILFWRQLSFLCGSRIQNFIQIAPISWKKNTKLPCDALRNFAFEQCIFYAFPRRSVFLLGIERELLLS